MKLLIFLTIFLFCFSDISKSEVSEHEAGNEMTRPISVKGVKSRTELDQYCQQYIEQVLPACEITDTMLYVIGKDTVLEVTCHNKTNGSNILIYFDISEYMSRMNGKNKKANSKFLKSLKPVNFPEGLSLKKPIVLKKTATREEVDRLQRQYLETQYPGYEITHREIWIFYKKFLERLSLKKEEEELIVNFDVSEYMNEYIKKHKLETTELSPGVERMEPPFQKMEPGKKN